MKPKSLSIAADIDADLRSKVEHAEEMLEGILKRAATRVEVSWKRGPIATAPHRSVVLTLTDTGVTREYEFSEQDFRDDSRVRWEMGDLWDSVLTERIEIQRQKVLASLSESEEN